jgi:Predicted nucleotide-binding protein containing TIR-like domain
MKPKVFIASSREALPAAEAVQRELSHDCEPVLWSQGVFRETNVPLEDLMDALKQFDFAVFVFYPQDSVEVRGTKVLSVRDNVLFELGLFLGELGRTRTFFITPKGGVKLHLPSDLSGITPSEYDPGSTNLQAAVGTALYQVKDAIRKLGTVKRQETVLYDSRSDFKPYHFEHRNGFIWKDNKPSTSKGEGTLTVLADSVLKITRTNTDGRNEIELLKNGPDQPSIPKKHAVSNRMLHISCSTRVEGGEHTLRFVAKDIGARRWLDSQSRRVTATDWAEVDAYLRVPSTSDLLFRIDDEAVSAAPSSIFIKNLKIAEEES